jgi:hypothetical protein
MNALFTSKFIHFMRNIYCRSRIVDRTEPPSTAFVQLKPRSFTMTIKSTIPALVACLALGGAGSALAQDTQPSAQSKAGTYGAGAAAASPQGAWAGGETAGKSMDARADRKSRHERRKARTGEASNTSANSTSTYGSGAVSTTRNSANAGVTSGASASGAGPQSAGSTVDAYGETTKDGSSADIYGDSAATSGAKR